MNKLVTSMEIPQGDKSLPITSKFQWNAFWHERVSKPTGLAQIQEKPKKSANRENEM